MKHLIKLYNDWLPVKDVFKRPKLYYKLGLWKHDPCLPVWRRGPSIRLYKHKWFTLLSTEEVIRGYTNKVYEIRNSISYKVRDEIHNNKDGSTYPVGVWYSSRHKLPKGLYSGKLIWRRDIRKKLKKYHLSWIKPTIQLPIWLSFHIFNHSMRWKTKWDEYRYEYPPQFTIIFFGISLSFWLMPIKTDLTGNLADHYWEAIMYYEDHKSLREAIEGAGVWTNGYDENEVSYFALRPEFLQKKYLEEYYAITSEIKAKREENIL